MPRLLDIIVTHYKEPWSVMKPFFDVLGSQKGIDFKELRVWLIQDGPVLDLFPESYFDDSPLEIVKIVIPHGGVSAARNYGLSMAESEWVMFCDCDDCFSSVFALEKIFYVLKSEQAKNAYLAWGSFYMTGNGDTTRVDQMNWVFIHNKYYRRSFLLEHGIRFSEDLHMSEDSAFNTLVKLEIPEHHTIEIVYNEPLYAWCRRKGSVTMDASKWIYNTEGHFDRNLYVLKEYRKRGLRDCNLMVARTITDVYAMLTKEGVTDIPEEFMKRAREFYQENREDFLMVTDEKLKSALDASDRDVGISEEWKKTRPDLITWIKENLE